MPREQGDSPETRFLQETGFLDGDSVRDPRGHLFFARRPFTLTPTSNFPYSAMPMPERRFAHIDCRLENGILVVVLQPEEIRGEDVADDLRQALLDALAYHRSKKPVLDFERVKFLASTAFRPLISLHRKLQELHGRMIFCHLHPQIAEVFIVTRLIATSRSATAPFEMAADLPEALDRLRHHTSRTEQGVLVLTLTEPKLYGEDLADDLAECLTATVTQAGARKVVMDFQQVEAITTPCMRPLIALLNQLRAGGGRLVLCNLSPLVAEVLTVTRLISLAGAPAPLESADNVGAAIATLNRA